MVKVVKKYSNQFLNNEIKTQNYTFLFCVVINTQSLHNKQLYGYNGKLKKITLYFKTIGVNEVYILAKNESGKECNADTVAIFENLKLIIYTQAKFQKGEISDWATNQILDYKTNKESIDDGYNKIAWVITTANKFNDNAENLSKEKEIQLENFMQYVKTNSEIQIVSTSSKREVEKPYNPIELKP